MWKQYFLDINPKKREILKSVRGVESDILALRHQGFDENLYNRLTSNKWRLLAKRVPLTELKELNIETVKRFATSTLQSSRKRPTIWREMF